MLGNAANQSGAICLTRPGRREGGFKSDKYKCSTSHYEDVRDSLEFVENARQTIDAGPVGKGSVG